MEILCPGTYCMKGWTRSRASLDEAERKEFYPFRKTKISRSVHSPITIRTELSQV